MVEHIVKCYKSGTPFCLPLVLDLLGVLLGVDGTLLQDLVIVDKAKCDTKRIKDVEWGDEQRSAKDQQRSAEMKPKETELRPWESGHEQMPMKV